MSDIHQKLDTMLDYWIQHNREHEKEFREWAGKAALLSTEAAQQLEEAACKMTAVSSELEKAQQLLAKNKEGH
jgi:hypothetical protein